VFRLCCHVYCDVHTNVPVEYAASIFSIYIILLGADYILYKSADLNLQIRSSMNEYLLLSASTANKCKNNGSINSLLNMSSWPDDLLCKYRAKVNFLLRLYFLHLSGFSCSTSERISELRVAMFITCLYSGTSLSCRLFIPYVYDYITK
jgi:hypothetical protein